MTYARFRSIPERTRDCEKYNTSQRELQRLRVIGGGPPYTRVSPRRIAYLESAADKYYAARTYASLAEEIASTNKDES